MGPASSGPEVPTPSLKRGSKGSRFPATVASSGLARCPLPYQTSLENQQGEKGEDDISVYPLTPDKEVNLKETTLSSH